LDQANFTPSVSSKGDSYDNALLRTINGLYKAEVIQCSSSWKTIGQLEFATLTWVACFNTTRLMQSLGYIPPAQAEEKYYAPLKNKTVSQGVTQ
jgi:putative transposase